MHTRVVLVVGKGVLLEMCPHCKSGIWGGKVVERCLQFRDVLIERGSTVD